MNQGCWQKNDKKAVNQDDKCAVNHGDKCAVNHDDKKMLSTKITIMLSTMHTYSTNIKMTKNMQSKLNKQSLIVTIVAWWNNCISLITRNVCETCMPPTLKCHCDLDLWPRNPKFNRGHLLMTNHHTKLEEFFSYWSDKVCLRTNRLTNMYKAI